jgi:hypothetical protein
MFIAQSKGRLFIALELLVLQHHNDVIESSPEKIEARIPLYEPKDRSSHHIIITHTAEHIEGIIDQKQAIINY